MDKILKQVAKWVGALGLLFCSFSYSNAQTDTNNILGNNWSGAINYTGTGGGLSGGATPGYNSTTNTIYFGYTQSTVAQTIAINNALQGSGVQVGGVKYGFSYLNEGLSSGTLSTIVNVTSNTGATLQSYSHSHGPTTNWTSFNQTQTFNNPYDLANLGNVSMSISGRDSRFWAGYYGPQVKDPYLKLTYTAATVTNPTFGDDSYVHVPLQFGFPFYGRVFTNSWMHSNGVVSFLDPAVPIPGVGYNPGQWAYCCGDQPTVTKPQFSFMIAPLWTDLYPVQGSTFRTEGTTSYQKYFWNNIAEISNMNNLNTFSLEIRPSGFIGINYDKINLQNQNTWIGLVGDPTLGQINERFYGIPGLNAHGTGIPNWSVADTPADVCAINPLSSPTCPGYFTAQCTISPLYNSNCPGYQAAYFAQQCSLNSLYNVNCPGYASAYLNYQCSINPLYSTTCEGYEQAYFNQQCSLNSLYSINCPGYQQAYFNQQCSLNGLYSTSCPNYQQAYFNQQCTLNGLYSTQCPNYAQAYATKLALETSSKNTTTTTTTTATETAPTVSTTGETKVAVVADKNVNDVITTTATSANPAQAATATVPLVQSPQQTETKAITTAVVQEQKKEEKKDATTTSTSSSSSSSSVASTSTASGTKEQPKTARQELQERREAAARAKAVEDGKNLAENMGKAVDMEQQKMVQNVVVQAMAFVPGFDAYNKVILRDKPFYPPVEIYKGQSNVDNRVLGRRMFGPTDQLHNEMVNQQYR